LFEWFIQISSPAEVISDSIFVGFAESFERLISGAHDLYSLFDEKKKEVILNDVQDSAET
jgi:hypothetical protein